MNEPGNSTQLLRDSIKTWEDLFGGRYRETTIEAWVSAFRSTEPRVLRAALEYVTLHARRRPSPGDLTEAIRVCREDLMRRKRDYDETETTDVVDGRTIPCFLGPDGEKRYRLEDIPEGRELLKILREKAAAPASANRAPRKPPQDARGATQASWCRGKA